MLDQTMIDRYLDEVDSYLHVDRAQRERVLAEIEGHLHDAVEAHTTEGVAPHEAMRRAIEDIGPPQDVAGQFSPTPTPARSVRGWRRWTPIILPAVVLAAGGALTAWNLIYVLRYGPTRGVQLALRYSLLYTAVVGALTAATFVAIHNGDRDPAWRRAAWLFAALTGVIIAMSYAL
jgi:hypothetical protein